jgi:HPt (histidine-containing phosphotransfer) domain-containing protein
MAALLLDRERIAEIRHIASATGQPDMFGWLVGKLEASLNGFGAAFSAQVATGDTKAAERAAHTLKGTCRQLGVQALGELFADIERTAKAGQYAEAQRKYEEAAQLIVQSLDALKQA